MSNMIKFGDIRYDQIIYVWRVNMDNQIIY